MAGDRKLAEALEAVAWGAYANPADEVVSTDTPNCIQLSQAISLKRIADALEKQNGLLLHRQEYG